MESSELVIQHCPSSRSTVILLLNICDRKAGATTNEILICKDQDQLSWGSSVY